MPYIDPKRRGNLLPTSKVPATNPGDLNFQLTTLVLDFMKREGESYTTLNEVFGVLELVKAELYRRIGGPYEQKKCEQNGDVY